MQTHTLTLSDLERGARMDIADAQAQLIYYTRRHQQRGISQRVILYCRAMIANATADIIEARGRIVALRKAGVR